MGGIIIETQLFTYPYIYQESAGLNTGTNRSLLICLICPMTPENLNQFQDLLVGGKAAYPTSDTMLIVWHLNVVLI